MFTLSSNKAIKCKFFKNINLNNKTNMAKNNSRSITPRSTNSGSNPNRSSYRPNPMTPKASITRSGRKSYGNGGKVK